MLPIADSPYAQDVAAWVAGGDPTAFTDALAAYEKGSWTGGHTGYIDESLATFDHQEYWIARCLARQGHNVIALPSRPLAGLRSPDAAVGGLLVEFKTYTGLDPRQLLSRVGHARPQADRVVVGAEAQWDTALVRSVFQVAIKSACQRSMRAVMFIGDDFQFEWGDWNAGFTASAATTHSNDTGRSGTALDHVVCRPSRRAVQSPTASPTRNG